MTFKKIILLFLILFFGAFLRLYQIDQVPPGLNLDEASQGYNAYSLLQTGADRYGKEWPVLLRSLGSYQPPLYTYLSIVPTYIFGPSIFSIRIVSVISGLLLLVVTFIFISSHEKFRKNNFDLLATFIVALSPWSIFFSRGAIEANLGLTVFITSVLFFVLSLQRPKLFIAGMFFLGVTSYAYYSERLSGIIFLLGFMYFFRKQILTNKKVIITGFAIFTLLQIPLLTIIGSDASLRRIDQVNYFSESFFEQSGGLLTTFPLGRMLFVAREFMSQYLAYFSPRNLFFDPDPQGVRSIPDLSVFYGFMLVPFIAGLKLFIEKLSPQTKTLILLLVIIPIPAALTRDPFYTTRILPLLWVITIIISLGIQRIAALLSFAGRLIFISGIVLFSLISLYISYFIFLKYERSDSYGFPYMEVTKIAAAFPQKQFVVDSGRNPNIYIWLLSFKKYNPAICQKQTMQNSMEEYYNNVKFDECVVMDNIEARPIFWKEDVYRDLILIGDDLAISDNQVKEHKLKFEFDIKDLNDNIKLKAYSTNPKEKLK